MVEKMISKIRNNHFFKNTSWLLAQNIYTMLLSLVIGAISARYLGPSNYGLIGYATSLLTLFSSVGALGIEGILVNELIRNPKKEGEIIGTCVVLRLGGAIFSYVGALGLTVMRNPENKTLWIVVALQGLSVFFQFYEVLSDWFNSKLLSKYTVIAYSVGLTVVSVIKVLLLSMHASVIWFAFASFVQVAACSLLVVYSFCKRKDFKTVFSIKQAKYILSKSHHYIIMNLSIALYMQMDKIMIGDALNEYEVGIYTAAVNISTMWEFVPMAIINSAKPLILERFRDDKEKYYRLLETVLGIVTVICIVAIIGIAILDKLILYIMYGEQYIEASMSLKILVVAAAVSMIGCARSIWIVAEDFNKYGKYGILTGALVNLVFNYFGIMKWGIEGAALGTLLTQIWVVFISALFWKKTRPFIRIYMNSIFHIWRNIKIVIKNMDR